MKILVLAAGFATRLWPLTKNRAKPLLEVAGRPVLDHLLARTEKIAGIEEIVLVTNARFREDFDDWASKREGVPVRVLDDGAESSDELRGALADLALTFEHSEPDAEGYLVLAGDNLIDFDLADFVAEFRERRCPMLLVRRMPGGVPPKRHGEVLCVEDEGDARGAPGRVLRFREKPADPESELAATGIYCMPDNAPALLSDYLAQDGDPDAPGHFFAWLVEEGVVHARSIDGKLWDIGNLESLEIARRDFVARTR